MPTHWRVFNNNNNKLIARFFNEPLIKCLWERYPRELKVDFIQKQDARA